jgi:integrase
VGAGPFSNQFYEKVLYPAGLVPKRTHLASKDANGKRKKHKGNPISYHSYRHTFISLLKTSGVSQSVAKALAAHASDRISDLYTHVAPEHMQQAIKLLPELVTEAA